MSHTPGPWTPSFKEAYYVTAPDLGNVAIITNLKGAYGFGGRRTGDEVAANCRLMAAAPDLLEALKRCRFDSLNMSLADLEFCRAAIAKATGGEP